MSLDLILMNKSVLNNLYFAKFCNYIWRPIKQKISWFIIRKRSIGLFNPLFSLLLLSKKSTCDCQNISYECDVNAQQIAFYFCRCPNKSFTIRNKRHFVIFFYSSLSQCNIKSQPDIRDILSYFLQLSLSVQYKVPTTH